MLKRTIAAILLTVCTGASGILFAANDGPVVNVAELVAMKLEFAGNADQRSYLGVGPEVELALGDVKADYLILSIFNSYCTICQEDAPFMNVLYEMIRTHASLSQKVRVVGLAPGNTAAEIQAFQTKFEVAFPLIPDSEFAIDRAIPQNMRTPMLLIVRKVPGKSLELVKWHSGRLANVESVIEETVQSAALDAAQLVAGGPGLSR
jgi:hypothetical protein